MKEFFDKENQPLIKDFKKDFIDGYKGINKLPRTVRFGVYLSYCYYYRLSRILIRLPSIEIFKKHIRTPKKQKPYLLFHTALDYKLNLY